MSPYCPTRMAATLLLICIRLVLVVTLTLCSRGECTDNAVKLLIRVSKPSIQERVTVTCAFDPKLPPMSNVDALILHGSKPDSGKYDWQILASVDRKEPNPRFLDSQNAKSFKLTGFFGFEDNKSELELSWTMLPHICIWLHFLTTSRLM